jgi:hypothetical protein
MLYIILSSIRGDYDRKNFLMASPQYAALLYA